MSRFAISALIRNFNQTILMLTCQGHFPKELRSPPTILGSGNSLRPHTARINIVELNRISPNWTIMLENGRAAFVQLDEPVPLRGCVAHIILLSARRRNQNFCIGNIVCVLAAHDAHRIDYGKLLALKFMTTLSLFKLSCTIDYATQMMATYNSIRGGRVIVNP